VTGCCIEHKPVDISLDLVMRRHFLSDASNWSGEKV